MMFYRTIFSLYFLLLGSIIFAQKEPIYLFNPSFEDEPIPGQVPGGWVDCSHQKFPELSPADTHPSGNFNVIKEAFHGQTYLGMVVRENDSWEFVSQRLSKTLDANSCYELSVYLARSRNYVSIHPTKKEIVNYNTPIRLKIWGGNDYCDRAELLAESKDVVDTHWELYHFSINPSASFKYLILEASIKTPTITIPNGNILVDKISPIYPTKCDDFAYQVKDKMIPKSYDQVEKRDRIAQTIEELKTEVTQYGQDIRFEKEQATLARAIFTKGLLNAKDAKRYFNQMINHLRYFPKQKLEIAVVKNGSSLSRKRVKSLKQSLKQSSVKKKAFKVKKLRKSQQKWTWLMKNKDIWVRIIPR